MSMSKRLFEQYQEEQYYKDKAYLEAEREYQEYLLMQEINKPVIKMKKVRKYLPKGTKRVYNHKIHKK